MKNDVGSEQGVRNGAKEVLRKDLYKLFSSGNLKLLLLFKDLIECTGSLSSANHTFQITMMLHP